MGQFKRVRKKSLTGTLQKRVNNVLTGKYKKAGFLLLFFFFVCVCVVLMRHYQVTWCFTPSESLRLYQGELRHITKGCKQCLKGKVPRHV